MYYRKDGSSKYSSFGILLLPSLQLVYLVGISKSPLNHGDIHLLDDPLSCKSCRWTVTGQELVVTKSKQITQVIIDFAHTSRIDSINITYFEVSTTLVGQCV